MYKFGIKICIAFLLSFSSAIANTADEFSTANISAVESIIPISLSKAESLLGKENVYFFDANTREIRESTGFIKDSIFINKEGWTELLPKDKEAILIFYCLNRLCFASSDAALKAQELGYKNVFVMLEGIQSWITSGRMIDKSEPKKALVKGFGSEHWKRATDVKDFTDGIHSEFRFGKIPSCRDCHGSDGIKLELANDKDNVNQNCVSCHEDTQQMFSGSVHDKYTNKRENLPMCSDCHLIHIVKNGSLQNSKQLSDNKCGTCHEKEQAHYHDTFHGKAMYLNLAGSAPSVAACYDCHGEHNIHKVTDEKSTLFGENKIKTCAKCHDGSNENFSNFIAHADHTDKESFPVLHYAYVFMTALVVAVFSFFGLHTFLWSIRLILMRFKDKVAWNRAKEAAHSDKTSIQRFSIFHRIQHFFMAASFLGLSFSGLPQKFYTSPWAKDMIELMGGPIMATKIHHISAFIMFAVFFSHIGEILLCGWSKKELIRDEKSGKLDLKKGLKALFGPDSLMPNLQDLKDMKAHIKWFFNKGERPQFDRWTYWEKFDYLAVFWGMFIIGFSGLMLWFPTFFSLFLPGWALNLATLVHSDEALLATGFIFAIHFFNTHFRADRFPMDMVIFSGNITEQELIAERKKWHERLKKDKKFDILAKKAKPFYYDTISKLIGFAMLFTGLVFLFLIIYAFADMIF